MSLGKSSSDTDQVIKANPIVEQATRDVLRAGGDWIGLNNGGGMSAGPEAAPSAGTGMPFVDPMTGRPTGAQINLRPPTGGDLPQSSTGDAQTGMLPGMPRTPGFYPGQTVAGMDPMRRAGLEAMYGRGAMGSPAEQAMGGFVGANLSGGGGAGALMGGLAPGQQALTSAASGQINPLVGQAFSSAAGDLTERFTEDVLPAINATFARAGRTGSGLQADALGNAAGELSDTLGGLASQMYGGAAESALNRQLQAGGALQSGALGGLNAQIGTAGLVPALSGLDYQNIGAMQSAGQGFEGYQQDLIDANRERYNYEANRPLNDFQRGLDTLTQYIGMTGPLHGTGTTQGGQRGKGAGLTK